MKSSLVERRFLVASLLIGASAGCSGLNDVDLPVELALHLDRTVVAAGDTLEFTATVHNPTDRRFQVGHECGPSLDVQLRSPEGEARSVLLSLVRGGVFTCELAEHHFIDPGETDRLILPWVAEAPRGTYSAFAHTRCGDEACPRSQSVNFVVD